MERQITFKGKDQKVLILTLNKCESREEARMLILKDDDPDHDGIGGYITSRTIPEKRREELKKYIDELIESYLDEIYEDVSETTFQV
jgi:hypothetical protein